MAWQFILTDLQGVVQGEITNADERRVALPHMRVPSASFRIPLYHHLVDTILSTDCLVRAYRTDNNTGQRDLAFHGPIVSAEESAGGDGQMIGCTAAGPFWRLTKRLIPGSTAKSGISFGTPDAVDLGSIAHSILTDVNAASFTGISTGSWASSMTGSVGPWWLKNAAEGITELTLGLNSFEFVTTPTEPTNVAAAWPQIATLDVAPIIGQTRSDAIFEYGTGKANVQGYQRQVSRDGLLNKAWVNVNGWPDGLPKDGSGNVLYDLLSRQDSASITARGLFEEVVNDAGVTNTALRESIGDFHVSIRKDPRQIITFNPVVNARPAPFVDYKVGDTVRARAVVRGTVRFDALFRIWGLAFTVDKDGNENVELELVVP